MFPAVMERSAITARTMAKFAWKITGTKTRTLSAAAKPIFFDAPASSPLTVVGAPP